MLDVAFVVCVGGDFDGEVTAIFPTEKERDGSLVCYAHVGQHASAAPEWVNEETRNATESERLPLYRELMGIYETPPKSWGCEPVTLWPVEWAYPAR